MMERAMSVEDKIRRAEEIYNRRRENEYKVTNARVRVDNNSNKSNPNINQRLKKMIIQIIVCMITYLIFYYVITNNYVFSEDFRNKCEEILAYDISFSEMYEKASQVITTIKNKYQETVEKAKETNVEEVKQENQEEQSDITEEQEQSNTSDENNIVDEQDKDNEEEQQNNENIEVNQQSEANQQEPQASNTENIGGAVEDIANVEENQNLSEEEQMEKDAEFIKTTISFIKPLEGVITSRFGNRNPTVSTVSKYHTGIDIAANEGTDIIAATSGTVVLASSKGAYGNHLKIQVGDVCIIYAHCLSLAVKEGDEIAQGQVIAKVGSTGNSTGPHLHFEIRREDRYVNPDLILDF